MPLITRLLDLQFLYHRAQARVGSLLLFSLITAVVGGIARLTLAALLRGRRRPRGEAAEALGRRVGRGAGGSEHLVARRWRRADAGRAHPGVARFLTQATTLTQASDIAGALEAEVTGCAAHHVLYHTAQLLADLAGVLDHHRLAEIAAFRDVTHVAAAQQRRLLELTVLLARRHARDRYVGMKIVLRIGEATLDRRAAGCRVLRGRSAYRAVQIVLARQLRRRRARFGTDGSPTGGVLVRVVAAAVPRELPSVEGRAVPGRLAGGQDQSAHLIALRTRGQVTLAARCNERQEKGRA